jgi:farnesyl-diphosphate farnesyltransferase
MPIWMAQRTLRLAEGNDDIFIANEPVKITREDVGALIADCVARCGDDVALADGWRRLGGTA